MTIKEDVLQYIKALAEQNIVTREEMNLAYDSGGGSKADVVSARKLGISEILYYIGGAIVFLGIAILVSQNWLTLGFGAKVLVTLGAGVGAYFVGVMLGRDERTETVGSAFYLISALVMPMGLYVVFDNAGFDANSYGSQSLISGILLGTYFLSYIVFRKNIFTLFSIAFGTWFFFSLTSLMISSGSYLDIWKFYEYRFLAVGIAYALIGYSFSKNKHAPLSNFLYGFGIVGFLGSALSLGGWGSDSNTFWEMVYPFLIFGVLFLSVQIKSKSFLTWGTIFLMLFILKMTSEYFSSGLGWPFALVMAGLFMIGAGYMSIALKNKYLL